MLESLDRALEQLPKDLSESYDRINRKIQSRPIPEMEIAHRTIQWVMTAPDPLTSEELLSAVRIKIESDAITLKDFIEQDVLLSICENLLIVDSNGQWRFFHLSVREYLQKIPEFNQQERHRCAQVCFLSLMRTFGNTKPDFLPDKIDSNPSSEHFMDPFNVTNAFSRHIQISWPFYASGLTANDMPFLCLESFLGSANKSSPFFLRWVDYVFKGQFFAVSFRSLKALHLERYDIEPCRTPIFAITHFSLSEIFSKFYKSSVLDPLQLNNQGDNLLYIAAKSACMPILRALVSNNVAINKVLLDEDYAIAASAASRSGSLIALKYLVEQGVDLNLPLQVGRYGSALAAASWASGNLDAVKFIVKHGADVNLPLQVGFFGSALAAASWVYDNLNTVKYLVEQGADVNLPLQAGHYGSALAAACCVSENLNTVRYLVEQGADVNRPLQNGDHGSALAAASWARNLDTVKYLVEQGADVNLPLQDGDYGSALAAASWTSNNLDTVKHLVEQGADVNLPLQDGRYGSALAAAASCRLKNLDTVKYLVEQGADVNLPLRVGVFCSATNAALSEGNSEVAAYLHSVQTIALTED